MLADATRREERDLALLRRYQDHGDRQAREQLVERFTPLVASLARRYAGRGEQLEDLIQVGMVGLVKAIERFDRDAGSRFVSFAAPNVSGEMKRHFRDHCWAVHVPRAIQELDARIQSERRAAASAGQGEPTQEQLAERIGVPVEQVREATTGGQAYNALSLDFPVGEGREVLETYGSRDPGYQRFEDRELLDGAMDALDDRDRDIVRWRYRDELLQREIAERVGVSQMQISRILHRSIERMHEHVAQTAA